MYSKLLSLVKTLCPILFYKTIYEEQLNPEVWPSLCQTGLEQTPININFNETIAVLEPNLLYNDYNKITSIITVLNDGKSIGAHFTGEDFYPSVIFNSETYLLKDVHFHWGSSEHSLNGQSYAGEVHLVHRNSNQNLLVLGALLEKTCFSDNVISKVLRLSGQTIIKYGTNATLHIGSTLEQFLNQINLNKYFTYKGSLTTPNCNEDVIWIVYQETVKVDVEAINSLQNIEDKNGQKLLFTNRNIQPLNNRKIYKSFQ